MNEINPLEVIIGMEYEFPLRRLHDYTSLVSRLADTMKYLVLVVEAQALPYDYALLVRTSTVHQSLRGHYE